MVVGAVVPVGRAFGVAAVGLIELEALVDEFEGVLVDAGGALGVCGAGHLGGEGHSGGADLGPVVGGGEPPFGFGVVFFEGVEGFC